MNEVQGPTPAGTSRPYRNLAEALRAHRIPEENHDFIAQIVETIGISSFIDRGRYIEAIRRGSGAALHIGRTYTNGFSEDEVLGAAQTLTLTPSEGRPPYFYVTHPSELPSAKAARPKRASAPRTPSASAAARTPKSTPKEDRDYGVCDVCFMVKTPSGGCGCD